MSAGTKKRGRPMVDEDREQLHTVSFKCDKLTKASIDVLTEVVIRAGGSVSGAQSIAIRRALVDAAAAVMVRKGVMAEVPSAESQHARKPTK